MHMVNSTMDWIIRFKLADKPILQKHIVHCHGSFVESLLCSWKGCRQQDETERVKTFHAMYKKRFGLLFGSVTIEHKFANLADPKACKDQLAEVNQQAVKHTVNQAGNQASKQAHRQSGMQASRQAGRQTGRQASKQAGKQHTNTP